VSASCSHSTNQPSRGADRHAGHHCRRLVLPRIPRPDPTAKARPVAKVVTSRREAEGAGFVVARPFPGDLSLAEADPFLLLDHVGPLVNAPGEAKGAP
jgi:hypothetical protein